ncbi:MAG: hypothetical protein R6X27_14000 [Candidatus Desulfacyla sp.]
MKPWQNIIISALVTIVAVAAAVRLFSPDIQPADMGEVRDTVDVRMKDIQGGLTAIQDAIENQTNIMPSSSKVPAMAPEKLSELEQKLDMILGKLSVLEKRISDVQSARAPQGPLIPPPMISGQRSISGPMGRQNPMAWREELSDEKRRQVALIFEEHARRVRERLPAEPDGRLPDRETMRKVMKESDWELQEDLKGVLTDEEYQRFLDSRPKRPSIDLPLPGTGPGQMR